jgi:hypothetical protein
LLNNFESIDIQHVPRIENQVANDLAQVASGYKISKQKLQELIKIKDKLVPTECPPTKLSMPKLMGVEGESDSNESYTYPKFSYPEIFAIDYLSHNDWRKPIVEYLENPSDAFSRKTRYRAIKKLPKTFYLNASMKMRLI